MRSQIDMYDILFNLLFAMRTEQPVRKIIDVEFEDISNQTGNEQKNYQQTLLIAENNADSDNQ